MNDVIDSDEFIFERDLNPQPAIFSVRRFLTLFKSFERDIVRMRVEGFKRAMAEVGYTFKVVEDGEKAVKAWKRYQPKVILMDISMPVLDGYQATETIRDIEKSQNLTPTPIVAVTAHATPQHKSRCLKHGMDDYLSKPLTMDKLQSCLDDWLGNERTAKRANR